jgi:hypothetical protein
MAAASTSPDLVGTVAAYTVARTGDDSVLASHGAVAFARLYDALASSDARSTWAKLSKVVGDRSTWDRCDRLARDLAKQLRRRPESVQDEVLSVIAQQSIAIADAVFRRLERDEPPRRGRFGFLWF